jgi:hypothetical protein
VTFHLSSTWVCLIAMFIICSVCVVRLLLFADIWLVDGGSLHMLQFVVSFLVAGGLLIVGI